eukprot:5137923-Karenia_brevis.AAC.1
MRVGSGQEGFIWRMGKRTCVPEPSTEGLYSEGYGKFGQRVHLDPTSTAGKAFMRNPDGGWLESPESRGGYAWGVPS